MKESLIHSIASRAEVKLNSTRPVDMMYELIEAGERDQDLYLDIIDAALSTDRGRPSAIKRILNEGRSMWTVNQEGSALIERVDPVAAELFVRATEPNDVATEELAEA